MKNIKLKYKLIFISLVLLMVLSLPSLNFAGAIVMGCMSLMVSLLFSIYVDLKGDKK